MSGRVDDWLASTLHGAGDGAFATTPDGKVVLWNAAAERLLGYTARDAIGRRCSDVIRGHDADGNRVCDRECRILACIKRRQPIHAFDVRTRTKTGRPVWVAMTVLGVPSATNGDTLTVHLMRDVTATKELLTLVHERLASAAPSANGAAPASATLTPRELEILALLAQGNNTARVAERLHVSRATVRNHVQSVLAKLGVHSRLEAVAYAMRQRLF